MWGFPGSGKSNFGLMLVDKCITQTEDKVLLRGDRFCEWRHFMASGFRMCLVIPKKARDHITEVNISLEEWAEEEHFDVMYVDHEKINVVELFIGVDILIFYDACFTLAARGWFWAGIFEQLVNRTTLTNTVITYLDHEAGVLLPEIALSESLKAKGHWRAVNKICELFVDFRKGLIRPILISQLEGEINHRLRQKCLFNVIRQGIASKGFPPEVQEAVIRQLVNMYTITIGKKVYTRGNTNTKYPEDPQVRKLICAQLIEHLTEDLDEDDNTDLYLAVLTDLADGYSERETARRRSITKGQVNYIRSKNREEFVLLPKKVAAAE